MEYLVLLEVPSTKSAIALDKLVKILKERGIDPQKTRFCCLDGTNSLLQRRIRHNLLIVCMSIVVPQIGSLFPKPH